MRGGKFMVCMAVLNMEFRKSNELNEKFLYFHNCRCVKSFKCLDLRQKVAADFSVSVCVNEIQVFSTLCQQKRQIGFNAQPTTTRNSPEGVRIAGIFHVPMVN
jgi:hypothetical protein